MLKIRLARGGRKRKPIYRIVVAESKSPRDGRFVEKIGQYDPNTNPASIILDDDVALKWLLNGAQPTDTVRAILSYRGIMLRKHLQIGVLKNAISQEEADKKFEAWKAGKDQQIQNKKDGLAQAKADVVKVKLAAETKIKEDRATALKKAKEVESTPQTPENAEQTPAQEPAEA